MSALKSLVACLTSCVVCGFACLGVSVGVAQAAGSAYPENGAFGGSDLVIPGAGWFLGGELAQDQAEADRANPEAVFERQLSRTAYARIAADQIPQLLLNAFPAVVRSPADLTSELPSGARVLRYLSSDVAQVELPGKRFILTESIHPIATRVSHDHFAALDLALTSTGAGYAPSNSDVAVRIPKKVSAGVVTPENGVSLTPSNARRSSLTGSPAVIDGSSVLYTNTQPATDTLVKPTATGFQMDAVLRSIQSPQQLYFKVGMPAGAELVSGPAGGAQIILSDRTIATILPPEAEDAAGTQVPTSMHIAGKAIVVSIEHREGSYEYPIEVDPEVSDKQLATTTSGKRSNWEFKTISETNFGHKMTYEGEGKESLETSGSAEYKATEWAYWGYETKGNSKIFEIKAKTNAANKGSKIESFLEFQKPGSTEETKKLLSTEVEKDEEYTGKVSTLCAANEKSEEECLPAAGKEKNSIHFQQSATAAGKTFSDKLVEGIVSISEPTGTHATSGFNTSSSEFEIGTEKRKNVLDGGGWLSKYLGAFESTAADLGIGVSATKLEYESSAGKWEQVSSHNYLLEENGCQGDQCYKEHGEKSTLPAKLPNGEDKIRYRSEDAMPGTQSLESEGQAIVKVDTNAPHGVALGGLPYGNELSEKSYKLTAEATDGEGPTIASSGIASIALFVDKHELTRVGGTGACTAVKGECTASGEWTINGSELGAGHDNIVLIAKDNAANETRLEETISVRHSTPVALGPGSLDLESGDFTLSAGDVSLGSGLSVSRDYSSRDLTVGAEGSLGPQWGLSMSTEATLVELANGSVLVTSANGGQTIFAAEGGGKFESPNGDSNLELKLEENVKKEKLAYYLKDPSTDSSTKFTLPSESKVWMPTKQEGAFATDTVIYTYETVTVEGKKITRPAEVLAPTPAKVECAPTMNPGCRKLKFTYAKSTTAKGEKKTEWGTYNGRLVKVSYEGYNPVTKAMLTEPIPVAEYEYDSLGRLRAAWDPRVSPALKTTYGYDEEGHVTALDPPGQEPWAFTYGTSASDAGSGRLIKATQAPASAGLWGGVLPKNTEAPKITGTPVVGITKMSVSNGVWENSPIVYGYQWEDCNSLGEGCVAIPGATNAGYVPTVTDAGHTLVVHVTATNGGGSVVMASAASSSVASAVSSEYSLPKFTKPSQIVSGADGNLWFTSNETDTIGRITTSGVIKDFSLPSGSKPYGITSGSDGNLWFAESGTSKIGKITTSGTVTEYSLPAGSEPTGVATGADKNVWFTETGKNKIGKITTSGTVTEYSLPAGSKPASIVAGPEETLWFTEKGTYRIAKATTAGVVTEYLVGGGGENAEPTSLTLGPENYIWVTDILRGGAEESYQIRKVNPANGTKGIVYRPNGEATGIATGSDKNLWFTEQNKESGAEKEVVDKLTPAGVATGYTVTSKIKLSGITSGPDGNLWFTGAGGNSEIGKITTAGVATYYSANESAVQHIATGSDGNLWYTDEASSRIGKITTAGAVTEYTLPINSEPVGITSGPEGNLWFVDRKTSKVGKITTSGTITEYSLTAGREPYGIVAGPDGNLWLTESSSVSGNIIVKMNTSGTVLAEYSLPAKSNPTAITVGTNGNLWFTDYQTGYVGQITTSGTVKEYLLGATSGPEAVVAGPDGNMWVAEVGAKSVARVTPEGGVTQFATSSQPDGITVGPEKNLWFGATGKIGRVTVSGAVTEYPSSSFFGGRSITTGPDGNLWIGGSSQIAKVIMNLAPVAEGSAQPGWTMEYGVPLEGSKAPAQMGVSTTTHKPEPEAWGQTDDPVEATSILPPDSPQGWPASSYTRATTYYLDVDGRLVNTSSPSSGTYGSISTTEYNGANDIVRTLTADNRATAMEAETKSSEAAKLLATYDTYKFECSKESENSHERESSEFGARLCETEGPEHTVKYVQGKEQKESLARNDVKYFYDQNVPKEEPYEHETFNLVTETTELTELMNAEGKSTEEVEDRKTQTSYSGQANTGWKLRVPTSVTVDPEGLKITNTTIYNSSTGQVTESRDPEGASGGSAHDLKTIYYESEPNTEGYAECGKHPEWAGLVCETLPSKQPTTAGMPKLPQTTTTYGIWDEPAKVVEVFGSTEGSPTRTTKNTYDEAGRLTVGETTATSGVALHEVTNEYSSKTGLLEKQNTTVGGKTVTITKVYNTLKQLESYTDADGNVAKFKYASPEKDGLLEEISDNSSGEPTKPNTQTYEYDPTTKLLTKLTDSVAGTFTAAYDPEGKMTSEVYPNGMCANYMHNSVGEPVHVEYIKTTNCVESKPSVWFSETMVPSVRGEAMSRVSTLSSETYNYDTMGRLSETQETPAGGECSVRVYKYDEESNRLSLTTRGPSTKCSTEGGTAETHTYDEANMLTDTGVAYDNFGNITKLPAADSESHEITSTYYVDGAVATQTQNGVTDEFGLDPAGRTRETISGGKKIINHYDGSGEAVAWTCELTAEGKCEVTSKRVRSIPGIDGGLVAVQTNKEEPVLQMHDLRGDVVATASLSKEATKLLTSYNSTEFGVPNAGKTPPPFAWLGASDVERTFSSGVVTEGATSYVPQIGRTLQSEEVEPPGIPGGSGAGAAYTSVEEPWNEQGAAREGAEAPGLEAARLQAAQEAAVKSALAAAGEGEDPTVYLGRQESEEMAAKLNKVTTLGEVADYLVAIPEGFVKLMEGVLEDRFDGVEKAIDWFKDAGDNLLKCAKAAQVCKFSDSEIKIKFTLPTMNFEKLEAELKEYNWDFVNLLSAAVVEGCTGIKPQYPGICFKDKNF